TDITVSPQSGTYSPLPIELTATKVNITGLAQKKANTTDPAVPFASEGTATLRLESDNSVVATSTPLSASGYYSFPAVTGSGPYVVEVALSGYTSATSDSFTPTLGIDDVGPTVTVAKTGGATITVTGATVAPTATASPGSLTGTCTSASTCTFTGMTAGTTYTVTVTPAGADADYLWAGTTTVAPTTGETATGSVTLAQRDIVVTVGPAGASGATVTLTPAGGSARNPTTSLPNSDPTTFTFARVPKSAGTITVSKTGYFTVTEQ
ncbi:MAG TPA: hypothetical protein PLV68_03235, partial [Ilumatobacteraceae bacterium]|nr:hypothetical protein [Ilumatobacteraceae bacterium]